MLGSDPVPSAPSFGAGGVPSGRFYRPELDGLRFLAFLGVFIHHSFPGRAQPYAAAGMPPLVAEWLAACARAGGFGVDLFFVLSAFLITELLLREHEARGRIDVRAFLTRRALRIWPLFYFFLVLSLVVDRLVLHRAGLDFRYLSAFAALGGNWACAFLGYPDSVAAPLWSVSIEEQFYLAFPVVLLFLGPFRLRALGVALIVVAAVSRVVTVTAGTVHPAVWCSTLCRLDTIGVGILLALFLRRQSKWSPGLALRLLFGISGLTLWILVEYALPVEQQTLAAVVIGYPMVYVGAAGMLVAVMGLGTSVLGSRIFVRLGRISYGLYVYHVMAIGLAAAILGPQLGKLTLIASRLALAFGLTVAMAAASYRYLETPFLALKRRFTFAILRSQEIS